MFADSTLVVLLGLLAGLPSFVLLAWALKQRQFDGLDAAAAAVFDDEELRYERPWETPAQSLERVARYGPTLPAPRGTWGGVR